MKYVEYLSFFVKDRNSFYHVNIIGNIFTKNTETSDRENGTSTFRHFRHRENIHCDGEISPPPLKLRHFVIHTIFINRHMKYKIKSFKH